MWRGIRFRLRIQRGWQQSTQRTLVRALNKNTKKLKQEELEMLAAKKAIRIDALQVRNLLDSRVHGQSEELFH